MYLGCFVWLALEWLDRSGPRSFAAYRSLVVTRSSTISTISTITRTSLDASLTRRCIVNDPIVVARRFSSPFPSIHERSFKLQGCSFLWFDRRASDDLRRLRSVDETRGERRVTNVSLVPGKSARGWKLHGLAVGKVLLRSMKLERFLQRNTVKRRSRMKYPRRC